jgi:Family of unknown function (DUF6677)
MANSTTKTKPAEPLAQASPITPMSVVAPAIAWLIPGAGHLIQKRWVRGALLMLSIVAMFLLGLAMEGRVYKPNGGDILDMLGFVGNVGGGGLYILTRALDWGHGAIAHATADYGTKFLIVAGLLNFIAVADAYHIAIGKKQ